MSNKNLKEMYIEYLEDDNKSRTTIKNYICGLEDFFITVYNTTFNNIDLDKFVIDQIALDTFFAKKLNKIAEGSLKLKLASVMSFIDFLFEEGICTIETKKLTKYIKKNLKNSIPPDFKQKEILTKQEMGHLFLVTELIGGMNKDRRLLMLFCLCQLGMRREEVCNLKLSDISRETQTIRILGKGSKYRKNTLNDKFFELYSNYLVSREKYKLAGEYVFCSSRSERISEDGIYKELEVIYKKSNVKKHLYPHMLRRSYASKMYKDGVDISIISSLLGHTSENTTRLYLFIDEEEKRKANAIADIF